MPRKSRKPSFIVELPLVVSSRDERKLLARFESARRLYNAALDDALETLRRMRESKQWQAVRAMPKGKPDSLESEARRGALSACIKQFGFTEYQFGSLAVAHKNAAGFSDRLGSHEAQKIGSRAFEAVWRYAFDARGRPRFKSKRRGLRSIESKTNATGIRWKQGVGCVEWKGVVLRAKLPAGDQDPYLNEALNAKAKYCRLVWRQVKGRRRWYVQLVQDGAAPAKYHFYAAGAEVGIDVGPSTIAIVGDEAVGLERFAPSVEQPWREQRRIQRAMDHSRRAMNPDNYDEKGRVKKGRRVWKKSKHYQRLATQLAEIERRLAAARKRDHGHLANRILGLGTVIKAETLSYKALQKCFGRSVNTRAPGKFIERLSRKAESAGGVFIELNTRRLRMSQYDHISDSCAKKPLSQRWHRLGGGAMLVQRDCYSAFLAKYAQGGAHNPSGLQQAWTSAEPLLARVGLCKVQSATGMPRGGPTVAVPSERIARERRLSRWSRPGCCSRKTRARRPQRVEAFRTPWL